jgi:hypothetical protein
MNEEELELETVYITSYKSLYDTQSERNEDWIYKMSLEDFEALVMLIENDYKFTGWNTK